MNISHGQAYHYTMASTPMDSSSRARRRICVNRRLPVLPRWVTHLHHPTSGYNVVRGILLPTLPTFPDISHTYLQVRYCVATSHIKCIRENNILPVGVRPTCACMLPIPHLPTYVDRSVLLPTTRWPLPATNPASSYICLHGLRARV